jgi:N-methylhydantoinase A
MADCRYIGQGYELPTLLPGSRLPDIEALPAAFHALHMERYGHSSESEDIEVVTLRITVMGGIPTAIEKTISAGNPKPAAAARLAVENVFVPGFEQSAVPVWDRNALLAGNVLRGPAIIHQMDATTLILDGQRATVTPLGDLLIEEMR